MRVRKHWIAVIFLSCVCPVHALGLTLEQAVQIALTHSEQMRMIQAEADNLRAEGDQAGAYAKPQIVLNSGYLEMGTNKAEVPPPVEFLNPPDRQISADLQASQVLYSGGRARGSLALQDKLKQQADLLDRSGRRDVRRQVSLAYMAAVFQKALLDVLQDRVSQRQTELEDARDLYEAGVVTSLDARQAKLSLNFAQDALAEGRADWQQALLELNLAMGRHVPEKLAEPSQLLDEPANLIQLLQKLQHALVQDEMLDLHKALKSLQAAEQQLRIAKGRRFPELRAVASGTSSGEHTAEMDESWQVGVQLQWPLWDGGASKAAKAAATARVEQQRNQMRLLKKQLAAQSAKIKADAGALQLRTGLQKEAVALSQANYEDARSQYRAGTITLTRLGEFNLAYAEARFNLMRLYFQQQNLVIAIEALLAQ